MSSTLTIGRVAVAAGVNVETIRFYQRLSLLAEPARPPGGVRRYGGEFVARLRFIKRAQQLGFSLAEVQRLLVLEDPQSCSKARSLAAEKLALVEARIADLERMRGVLKELMARCDVRRGKVACPIIATLTDRVMPTV
ncbi:MAG: Hg(II)-responsive transcriptional regulator [Betaproteobacteria bacterium]|nr:Hg(II)-responsive transcriptional regulator [Betaproteobacteria bacterium]